MCIRASAGAKTAFDRELRHTSARAETPIDSDLRNPRTIRHSSVHCEFKYIWGGAEARGNREFRWETRTPSIAKFHLKYTTHSDKVELKHFIRLDPVEPAHSFEISVRNAAAATFPARNEMKNSVSPFQTHWGLSRDAD
ncbi:unnamed protein product [Darwinula stevensoni]|uniref:Uncharacterized protein n=1 Tax=Darwinula stevensoni TaxID=69355 RepID=A0A7R9ADF5_9CRUS|nr:unnamed protein product [Darwinula stevensoni]CAG0900744.1 unnamed protein product [Darwinula stevensoni]